MRTFEQQRREFIELALKLIGCNQYVKLILEYDFAIFRYPSKEVFLISLNHTSEYNETELQKLRDLVGELG